MDPTQVIAVLITVITSLSGAFVALGKLLLTEKDKQITYRDTQIVERDRAILRWEGVATTNGGVATESLRVLKELQETTENIERELTQRQPAPGGAPRKPRGTA